MLDPKTEWAWSHGSIPELIAAIDDPDALEAALRLAAQLDEGLRWATRKVHDDGYGWRPIDRARSAALGTKPDPSGANVRRDFGSVTKPQWLLDREGADEARIAAVEAVDPELAELVRVGELNIRSAESKLRHRVWLAEIEAVEPELAEQVRSGEVKLEIARKRIQRKSRAA